VVNTMKVMRDLVKNKPVMWMQKALTSGRMRFAWNC
jgi:hypothetical protein